MDVVVADHCRGLWVFLGDGKGNWDPVVKAMATEFGLSAKAKELDPEGFIGMEAVAVGDVNGDGFPDLGRQQFRPGRVDGLPGRRDGQELEGNEDSPACPTENNPIPATSILAAGHSTFSCGT